MAALDAVGPARQRQREAKSAILQAIDQVAERLNNTRAVCRKYYVHPAVLETYEAGTLHEALANGKGAGPPRPASSRTSRRVVRLLRHVSVTNATAPTHGVGGRRSAAGP